MLGHFEWILTNTIFCSHAVSTVVGKDDTEGEQTSISLDGDLVLSGHYEKHFSFRVISLLLAFNSDTHDMRRMM